MERFRDRSEIADYLRISRMTLNRWEKIVPLPMKSGACHIGWKSKREIDAWYKELLKKYTPKQPYINWRRKATEKQHSPVNVTSRSRCNIEPGLNVTRRKDGER